MEIDSLEILERYITENASLRGAALRDLDLRDHTDLLKSIIISQTVFLGCTMDKELMASLIDNNLIFPSISMPFDPYTNSLYRTEDLYRNFDRHDPKSYIKTPDAQIYNHYVSTKRDKDSILETFARRLHDYSITNALNDEIRRFDEKKVSAIMGGHSLKRGDENYFKAALISKRLCEEGYLMLSGGGPGAMEATHLGAWFAKRDEAEMHDSIDILKKGESYKDELWLSAAFEVMETYPKKNDTISDIGIPTWHYGHEPPTPFAARIAKYFANSVREEGLLALAKGGIVYTPGSAGTIQEIFQDAAQNHYKSYDFASPMVFLGKEYWTHEKPVYGILKDLSKDYDYGKLISIHDDVDEIVKRIINFSKGN